MDINDLPPRIRSKVDASDSGCWIWMAAQDGRGYGAVWTGRSMGKAYRFVYESLVGPVPSGLQLDHLCRVTLCVNPAHLEPVTPAENARRGLTGAHLKERTHCPRGHDYAENAYSIPSRPNARYCQACNREKSAERRARQRELRKREMIV